MDGHVQWRGNYVEGAHYINCNLKPIILLKILIRDIYRLFFQVQVQGEYATTFSKDVRISDNGSRFKKDLLDVSVTDINSHSSGGSGGSKVCLEIKYKKTISPIPGRLE